MFLSRLFKHARTKALVVLAGLSMTLGVGATISTVAATQQNDVVETKAALADGTYYMPGSYASWAFNDDTMMTLTGDKECAYKVVNFSSGKDSFKITQGKDWTTQWNSGHLDNRSTGNFDDDGGNIKCYSGYGQYTVVLTGLDSDGVKVHIYNGSLSYQKDKVGWLLAIHASNESGFSLATALEMSEEGLATNDYAKLEGVSMAAGTRFQIAYGDGWIFKSDGWKTGSAGAGFTKDGDKFVVSAAGTVDVYGYNDGGYKMSAVYHAPTYTVSFIVNNASYGSVSRASIADVASGTSYSVSSNVLTVGTTPVTATAKSPTVSTTYSFVNWTSGGSPVSSGTITGDVTFTANFSSSTRSYRIEAVSSNADYGTVSPASTDVPYNTSHTIVATPKSGYSFQCWKNSGGTQVSTSASYTIGNVTAAETYTAYFISAKTIYVDAGNLSFAPNLHWWYKGGSGFSGSFDAAGVKVTATDDPTITTYADSKVYRYTFSSNSDSIGLQFSKSSSDFTWKTNDINYSASTNAYQVVATTEQDPDWSGVTSGVLHVIRFYKVLDEASPEQIGDPIYLMDGLSFDPGNMPTVEGYHLAASKWNTQPDGEGTSYSHGDTWPTPTGSFNLYALFTLNSYTITYYRVFNGELASWWGTSTVSANHFQTYSEIEPSSLYGFVFEGWYSDSSCTTGIGSNVITGNATVYAKYSSNPDNKIVYVALPSGDCYNNVTYGGALRVWYQKGDPAEERIKDAPANRVEGVTSTNLYMASIPSDSTGFSFHAGLKDGEMQAGKRTYWTSLSDASSHNLYVCATKADAKQDGQSRYPGEWKDCYFQFQTASDSAFTANLAKTDMAEPSNMSTGNDAEALGVAIPASYYFKVVVVINGTENPLTTVGTDANTTACTKTSGANQAKATALTVNAYLKNNVIYLLDTSSIDGGGYLYISTSLALSDVHLTVSFQNDSSVTVYPFSAARLSTVSGASRNSSITFNSVTGLARVPIYNFRGNQTPKAGQSYTIEFSNGSGTSRTIALPQATTNPKYYINLFNDVEAANSNNAQAAALAYDIGAAMQEVANSSICNVSTSTASSLVSRYNTLAATSAIKTILEATSIATYNYGWSAGTGTETKQAMIDNGSTGAIGLPYLYVQLCAICGETPTYAPTGAWIVPGPSGAESPLTLTLWIVLGAGVLGLGAIGTAYFVSKKKKRPQA